MVYGFSSRKHNFSCINYFFVVIIPLILVFTIFFFINKYILILLHPHEHNWLTPPRVNLLESDFTSRLNCLGTSEQCRCSPGNKGCTSRKQYAAKITVAPSVKGKKSGGDPQCSPPPSIPLPLIVTLP